MSEDAASGEPVSALAALLDVAPSGEDRFCGSRYPAGRGRVFGGQVVGQALVAAARSVPEDRDPHALHAAFMRPGDEALAIDYDVLRDFDGGSFSTRRVTASQEGRPILTMTLSCQRGEDGLAHGTPLPAVPTPDRLTQDEARANPSPVMRHFLARFAAFELRPVPPFGTLAPAPQAGPSHLWFRLRASAPADPVLRAAMLAYFTDFGLLTTAVLPHGIPLFGGDLQVASLDHAVWLHEPPALDEWLLYTMESPWAGHARALTRGTVHTADGRHIASVAQEGLIRPLR